MQPRRKKRSRDKSDVFQGNAHALLVMIYQDQMLPLALRLDAAKAAIPFEKPALPATWPASPELDAALNGDVPIYSNWDSRESS